MGYIIIIFITVIFKNHIFFKRKLLKKKITMLSKFMLRSDPE